MKLLLPQLALLLLSQAAIGADVSDTALTSILERHFGDATPAGGASPSFPRYLVADLNADGRQDLVVAFSDAETLKRGDGCHGLGIVHSYLGEVSDQTTHRLYNCFKAYSLEKLQYIPVRNTAAQNAFPNDRAPSTAPCLQIVLTYDDRVLRCWIDASRATNNDRLISFYVTLNSRDSQLEYRTAAPSDQSLQRASRQ